MKTILLVLALLAAPLVVHAEPANIVTVTTGTDDGLVVGVGYARAVPVHDRAVRIGGDVTFGLGAADVSDYRVRAGVIAPALAHRRWRVLGALAFTLRGAENELADMTGVGVDAAIHGGYYARRAFAGVELGVDWAAATHLAHSDEYRMNFPDARDRWIGNAGAIVRAGVQSGVHVGRVDVVLRAGRLVQASGGAPLFPIYATLSADTHF